MDNHVLRTNVYGLYDFKMVFTNVDHYDFHFIGLPQRGAQIRQQKHCKQWLQTLRNSCYGWDRQVPVLVPEAVILFLPVCPAQPVNSHHGGQGEKSPQVLLYGL